ncbi:unnamed protein product [Peronospora belbahrii]|uniref:Gamma tubulin complex component C-terminal domain-containing protein n=1 Tax=Peronospora belbahrii TaxID=622444 RepID=A0ABN8D7D3_9STRA|nr:unnamed protein product [Peronospora belbahrii]
MQSIEAAAVAFSSSSDGGSIINLLKLLRSKICCESYCNLRRVLPVYEHLLSPRPDSAMSCEHKLLTIRATILSCGEYGDVHYFIDRMDQVVEYCLSINNQLQQQRKDEDEEDEVPIGKVMQLLVDLAGGKDGKTFVVMDSMQFHDRGKKRIGDRIGMHDVEIVQRSKALFSKAPVPLEEKACFSQNLFSSFGNGIPNQHVSLWCPDSSLPDDENLVNVMSNKQRNQFFNLPGTPSARVDVDRSFMPSNDTPCRERFGHASTHMTSSAGHVKCLTPTNEVFFYDSTQEVHSGVVEQVDWEVASSVTETSSWYSDRSPDITEPWIAQTFAWEDLGGRIGLPNDYQRPSSGKVPRSLHDLVIPNEFAGKNHNKDMLLEIHEVDLVEDCLRALSGINSTVFRRHFQSATFQLPEKYKLKLRNTTVSATLSVLEVFREAGTMVMRLELLAIYYSQDPSRGGKTLQVVGDALQLYLSMHRTFAERIAQQCLVSSEMDQEDEVASVTKLVCNTRKLCDVLKTVGHIFGCDQDVFWPLLQQGKLSRGVALLNHLHHHVSSLRVDDAAGHIHELVVWFLVKACSPFLSALSDLISSGRVDEATDPFEEFRLTTWSRQLFEKAAAGTGDGIFSDNLSVDAIQMLPSFLEKIAPLVIHLSQVQALLRSVNAIKSTHPLVNIQPLFICTCSNKATEYAEEWQSIIDEAVVYGTDVLHTISSESSKRVSTKMDFASTEERRRKFVLENIKAKESSQLQQKNILDEQILEKKPYHSQVVQEGNADGVRQRKEINEAEMDEEALGSKSLVDKNSTLMMGAEEQHDCIKWQRDRNACLSTATEQLQMFPVDDMNQRTPDKPSRESATCVADVTEMISLVEEGGNTTSVAADNGDSLSIAASEELSVSVIEKDGWTPSVKVHKEVGHCCEMSTGDGGAWRASVKANTVLGNCSSISANNDTWRASIKVNLQADSHSSGSFKSLASTGIASCKTGVRVSNEPGGSGAHMYETLYGGSDIVPAAKDADYCVAASMTDSRRVEFPTTDFMPTEPSPEAKVDKDVHMQDVSHKEKGSSRSTSDKQDEGLSSQADGCVKQAPSKFTHISLPPVHPFFSMAIPQEDCEVLTRALTENNSEADFTSFASTINSCVEIPVRLVFQKLEQVAVDWLRNSLQMLEHLRWLRKLMLMSEGLCMDIFARDFLFGFKSSTRVNWGAGDRLTSALTLAMIEGSVSMNTIAQNFHYKTTAVLSQILSSLTMIPAVPSLLSELELVYDVKWPLGLVITSRSLNDYKQLHRFLLHMRMTSLEMREVWGMLRTIRQKRRLSSLLERLCGGVVYKMQAFLQAFNETFATEVFMLAWSELKCASQKATTLTDLRRCHEEYVSIALCCCFLDTPAIAIRPAISAVLTAAWKLTGFIRSLERQVEGRASDNTYTRVLCDELDVTLRALVCCLYDASRNADRNTRKFSECLLLRLNFNQYYSTDIPTAVAASATRKNPTC